MDNKIKFNKKLLITAILIFFIFGAGFTSDLKASAGAGIILLDPTGLTLKFNNFPVLEIGWSMNSYFHINCDYWIKNDLIQDKFSWFIGAGGKIFIGSHKFNNHISDSNAGFGLRIPIGLQFFADKSIEIFGEIAPGLWLFPGTDADFDGGIGIRYYIN